ncbi:MAG: sigma-70 family RNA polymerase sigma factor [Planctomycetaceae bacterium]|nr:sigma-70 family RNA polymerase sigma factor [Planctomycetaceae bacterium]
MNDLMNREASSSEGSSGSSMSLLDRVRAHDPVAWRQLVAMYGPLIGYWCRQAGLQSADIADVTQSVFMAVSRRLPNFRQLSGLESVRQSSSSSRDGTEVRSGLFRNWLAVVTKRKLIDWHRSTRPDQARGGSSAAQRLLEHIDPRENSHSELMGGITPSQVSHQGNSEFNNTWETEIQTDQELSRVWSGVVSRGLEQIRNEFQPQTWAAFWRTVVDGQTTQVVANELNLSTASVRQAKSRILRRLRQQLGDL